MYIIALPFFGVVSEVIPVFSRRPLFGYKGIILATLAITALSTSVWAHHMYTTGVVALPFFAATTFLIAVPTGVKVFSWIGTMWGGSLTFPPPMLFSLGFLVTFVIGGLSGVILASPTLDFHLHDSYFVVAHFHYVMGGTVVFALFAAIYFWWPKVTGRFLSSTLGAIHFWLLLIGFHTTFFVMHLMGYQGLPRRVVDYPAIGAFERWNVIATVGYAIQALSMVPFVIAIVRSLRQPPTAGADPWHANSLEWSTTSPPPHHNFVWLPPIRSERPTFDYRWINDPGGERGRTERCVACPHRPRGRRWSTTRRAIAATSPTEGGAVNLSRRIWLGGVVHFVFFTVVYAIVADDVGGADAVRRRHRLRRPRRRMDVGVVAPARRPCGRPRRGRRLRRAGPVGVFAAASLRPLALGVGMTGIVLGVVIGVWMTLVGLAIVVSQVALLVRDVDSSALVIAHTSVAQHALLAGDRGARRRRVRRCCGAAVGGRASFEPVMWAVGIAIALAGDGAAARACRRSLVHVAHGPAPRARPGRHAVPRARPARTADRRDCRRRCAVTVVRCDSGGPARSPPPRSRSC